MAELPPSTPGLHMFGALLETLEERCPGFTECWFQKLNEQAMLDTALRFRGPQEAPEVIRSRALARNWAAVAAVTVTRRNAERSIKGLKRRKG
jgi:hypothetical protein